ncbi:MAG: hypothetical protein GX438_11080 [Treponema sp.]|nr:hypothetical protein [Treponema sp.]
MRKMNRVSILLMLIPFYLLLFPEHVSGYDNFTLLGNGTIKTDELTAKVEVWYQRIRDSNGLLIDQYLIISRKNEIIYIIAKNLSKKELSYISLITTGGAILTYDLITSITITANSIDLVKEDSKKVLIEWKASQ